jgi:hypothetical protein
MVAGACVTLGRGIDGLHRLKTIKVNQAQGIPMRDMLPASLSRLCNRLAAEQTKAQTWRLGLELRQEYQKRLGAGESIADLERDVRDRVLHAAQEQLQQSAQPARDRLASRPTRE